MRISDWSSDVCSSDLLGKRSSVQGDYFAGRIFLMSFFWTIQTCESQCTHLGDSFCPIARYADISALSANGLFVRRYKGRSEEHTSELQSLMRISYAVFCLKNKNCISSTAKYKNSAQFK